MSEVDLFTSLVIVIKEVCKELMVLRIRPTPSIYPGGQHIRAFGNTRAMATVAEFTRLSFSSL